MELVDNSWYFTAIKGIVVLLAGSIFYRIIKQSLWNFGARVVRIAYEHEDARFFWLLKELFSALINVIYIWFVLQGLIILVMGVIGVSPKELVQWRFQEVALIATLLMTSVCGCMRMRQKTESD
ncbi:hypothetical protein [Microbulbifer epialgicus]|uniref:Small-conductance mechanosensitive channel n=1 Tax=Microbulbifer epialgicus TaxID=393907 RepID=A0ABV4NTN3_9GAMM